jgi:pSer/pThr/pTyr-binding forkhead associated (FHA) protein
MIECPRCHTKHVTNTLFCGDCGRFLPAEDAAGATPGTGDLTWLSHAEDRSVLAPVVKEGPIRLRIRVIAGGQTVELTLDKPIILGRMDPAGSNYPDLDLSPFGGMEKGVSRRHARISERKGEIVAEDLASINNTTLNGKRLVPYLPEVLHDGDQLQLGSIAIEVEVL